MSKDSDKGGFSGRLWGGGGRDKEHPTEREQPTGDKVVRLDGAPGTRLPPHSASLPDRTYLAFELREHAERIHIRCATQPSRLPSYNYLLDIIYDHDFESIFTLIYSFMTVEITGRNLWPLVHAINFGTCERIYEYHPKLYDPPAKDATVVESVTITSAARIEFNPREKHKESRE